MDGCVLVQKQIRTNLTTRYRNRIPAVHVIAAGNGKFTGRAVARHGTILSLGGTCYSWHHTDFFFQIACLKDSFPVFLNRNLLSGNKNEAFEYIQYPN